MKRFFNKINKTPTCWLWTSSIRGKSGYGAFKLKGKTQNAHRVSYLLHNSNVVLGSKDLVCHTCDNRLCVNPNHLFIGTQSDNMRDCFNKKRGVIPEGKQFKKGHKPKTSLLKTSKEILELKNKIFSRTCSLKKLSEELSLPYQLLRDISSGRVYK